MTESQLETPCFLRLGNERLFAVRHSPVGSVRGGFLFCHPLGEEKLWAHRVYVGFARRLALAGWQVLRIDFRGEGDSDRAFGCTDVRTRLEDTRAGLDFLRQHLPPGATVGLLGLRFGAALAAVVAAEANSGVSRLVLWDPVVQGSTYMQSLLMINLAYQMAIHRKVVEDRKALVERMRSGGTVNIEGYELSGSFFEEASALQLGEALGKFTGRGLLVQISPTSTPVRKDLEDMVAARPSLRLAQAEEEPFWKEIKTFYQCAPRLADVTHRWIEESA